MTIRVFAKGGSSFFDIMSSTVALTLFWYSFRGSHHFSNPDTFPGHHTQRLRQQSQYVRSLQKTPTPTTIYITPLLTLSTARMAFPIPSSCAFAVFALRMMTSCRNARKCPPFSRAGAIPRIYCRPLGKGCRSSPAKKPS